MLRVGVCFEYRLVRRRPGRAGAGGRGAGMHGGGEWDGLS